MHSSCFITNTSGFYSGYKKLEAGKKEQVQFWDDSLALPKEHNNVLAIAARSLLASLAEKDTAIVYIWSAHCKSDACIPIFMAQNFCNKRGYELYVVASYYDDLLFANIGKTKNPLTIINHKYYKTDYCPRYSKLFLKDLDRDKFLTKSNNYFRFLIFSKGKLIQAQENLN